MKALLAKLDVEGFLLDIDGDLPATLPVIPGATLVAQDDHMLDPVSYTHLDVYKRQVFTTASPYFGGVTGSYSPLIASTGTSPLSGLRKSGARLPLGHTAHCACWKATKSSPITVSASFGSTAISGSSVQITDLSLIHI